MPNRAEPWLIPQIERLARTQPERLAGYLCRLQSTFPELYEALTLAAIEHGDLSSEAAAEQLGLTSIELEFRLESYRQTVSDASDAELIEIDPHGVARLRGSVVAVWEIVREFRRAGSVAELRVSFPSLPESSLRAALSYTGRNPDAIAAQIQRYEASRTPQAALVEARQ